FQELGADAVHIDGSRQAGAVPDPELRARNGAAAQNVHHAVVGLADIDVGGRGDATAVDHVQRAHAGRIVRHADGVGGQVPGAGDGQRRVVAVGNEQTIGLGTRRVHNRGVRRLGINDVLTDRVGYAA